MVNILSIFYKKQRLNKNTLIRKTSYYINIVGLYIIIFIKEKTLYLLY